MRQFQIGEVIEWEIGRTSAKGIVRNDCFQEVEVLCLEINGKKASHKLNV